MSRRVALDIQQTILFLLFFSFLLHMTPLSLPSHSLSSLTLSRLEPPDVGIDVAVVSHAGRSAGV